MNKLCERAQKSAEYASEFLELNKDDVVFKTNRIFEILQNCGNELTEEDEDKIYGELSLLPSQINARFSSLLKESAVEATAWFYSYCVHNKYVRRDKLDKNTRFESEGLIITINRAKPEFRDPKKAVSGNSVAGGYPLCSICRENEGFGGRNKRNLRTVDITLGGEKWFWQYSPYGYFNEHGIAVNCVHTPMKVDRSTFVKLFDFVDIFPHYFIGCNAPLPRIGGSVLAHDHFQGGGEVLPLHTAGARHTFKNCDYPSTICEIPEWNGTVIRLISHDKKEITEIAERVREAWETYKNAEIGIIPEDENGAHNAISPTVLKTARGYEMNIILRSNITSEEYPDGVFHAHPEYHAIKKESIGLIEAQGLFILPGRLDDELKIIEDCLAKNSPLPAEYATFNTLYSIARSIEKSPHEAVKQALGKVCSNILSNTAVFKEDKYLLDFMCTLGFKL